MVQLNFHDAEEKPIGILNWFAVHPTSMPKTNRLISGDNKGAASLMMEKLMCPSQLAGNYPLLDITINHLYILISVIIHQASLRLLLLLPQATLGTFRQT